MRDEHASRVRQRGKIKNAWHEHGRQLVINAAEQRSHAANRRAAHHHDNSERGKTAKAEIDGWKQQASC